MCLRAAAYKAVAQLQSREPLALVASCAHPQVQACLKTACRRQSLVAQQRAFVGGGPLQLARPTALSRQQRWCSRQLTVHASGSADVAEAGDHVEVHYTGTLDDGTVFDSSRERSPLPFTIGGGQVIAGFDLAVTGLAVGETRKQRMEAKDAYGEWSEDNTAEVPKEAAPEGLKAGDVVRVGNGARAVVTEVTDKFIKIDANHELAGKALTFDVELVSLAKAVKLQTATFGLGCFWGPELAYQRVPGVVSTAVGYTNGSHPNPTYEDVCSGTTGHAEVVQVMYDPAAVPYSKLLDLFWERHDPTTPNRQGNDTGTQYRSGIYTHTAEQMAEAKASLAAANERLGGKVVTELAEVQNFHMAEPYHQQYLAKGGRNGRAQDASKGCNDPIRCYG